MKLLSGFRSILRVLLVGEIVLMALPSCGTKLVAPDRTPLTYKLYAGTGLVRTSSPIYIGWEAEPVFLGESDTTDVFDLSSEDSVDYLTITMNRNVERALRDKVGTLPGEIWIDAIRDLRTGVYLGATSDGTVHDYYSLSLLGVHDVLDTTTGLLSTQQSIENLVGPPDGKYVVLRYYDTSFIAIRSLTGSFLEEPVLVNQPGPDVEVFARTVPVHLRSDETSRISRLETITVERLRRENK